ncbi:hypothetical protein NUW58_g2877 [Xylaria curta]|uniref:Uncharacterized protein n=1 Tax=Xylaria curta TaxID=42375 RepID=A0ACC1PDI5_9PEZI|nr:hypothetical protein NUW58_g2877 [Xylaria curta]
MAEWREQLPEEPRPYQRRWQRPENFGIIKYFSQGFRKLVQPHEDLSEFTVQFNDLDKCYNLYDPKGNFLCVEFPGSWHIDNGPGKGYTYFYGGVIKAGAAALEIYDKYDGERDIIYGGRIPYPGWTDRPVGNPEICDMQARVAIKDNMRARVPLSDLYYHPDALLDPSQYLVILAGPSLFSPECEDKYSAISQKLQLNGSLQDSELPQNWHVLVDQYSLVKLVTCFREHDPTLFWKSKSGYVYPMLYIFPEKCFTWTPRDFSSWIPEDNLQDFLDTYEYESGELDPRIPAAHWPEGQNCASAKQAEQQDQDQPEDQDQELIQDLEQVKLS